MTAALEAIAAYLLDWVVGFVRRHPWLTACLILLALVGPPLVGLLSWLSAFFGANAFGKWLGRQLAKYLAWLGGGKAPAWWAWLLLFVPGGFIVLLWLLVERAKIKRVGDQAAATSSAGTPAGPANLSGGGATWGTLIQV